MKNLHSKNPKNWLKVLSLSSLMLLGTSCSEDETIIVDSEPTITAAKSSNSVELSYNSITASTQQSANPIGNIDDASSTSRWSGFGTDANVYVDFGEEVTVDYINMSFYNGDERSTNFTYWESDNGSSWTYKGEKNSSGNTDSHEEFDLSNITARYFRLKFQGNTTNDWNSVTDLEIYGTPGDGDNSGTCNASTPSGRSSNASSNSATLSWNSISNIDHYNVRYRPTSSSSWSYKYSLSTNSVSLTGLSSGTNYEWQIRAKCPDGSASEYADGESTFTTDGSDGGGTGDFPHDILGLNRWKISLPRNTSGILDNGYAESDEVYIDASKNDDSSDPSLMVYSDEFFYVNDNNNVIFSCPADKSLPRTSTGTSNTRTELREMPSSGNEEGWDAGGSTVREMNLRVRVLQTSSTKKLAFAQIHDFGEDNWDDLIRIQIESDNSNASIGDTGKIYVMGDMAEGLSSEGVSGQSSDDRTILENYVIGDWLDIRVTYNNDTIRIYLDGDLKQTYTGADCPSNYFKAGIYNQSMSDSSSGTGIVEFESLSVTDNF